MHQLYLLFLRTSHALLLIAQPQSSSTATASQLGMMLGIRSRQAYPCKPEDSLHVCTPAGATNHSLPCEYPNLSPFHQMATAHSDVCEVHPTMLETWVRDRSTLYKQHLTPSPQNVGWVLAAARKTPQTKVLLLTRNVSSTLHAICERALHDQKRASRLPTALEMEGHAHAIQAWQWGWQSQRIRAADTIWQFTYETMERQRERTLRSAASVLNLSLKHGFVDLHKRLVNKSDPACSLLSYGPGLHPLARL